MTRFRWIATIAVATVAGVTAFLIAQRVFAQQSQPDAVARWLDLTADQAAEVKKDDPDFTRDSAALSATLRAEREKLAALLEAPAADAAAVHIQLDRVLDADAALQKRIVVYVLKVRDHLTPAQKQRLMGLCAQSVRGQGRGGGRGPLGGGLGDGRGPHGPGGGMGRGGGRGWGAGRADDTQPAPTTTPATSPAKAVPAASQTRPAMGGPNNPHATIWSLFEAHKKIVRKVEERDNGVVTITTSDDPTVTALLRTHVSQMKTRLTAGQVIRRFDPLFVELFAHHAKIRMDVEEVPGGVKVTETSDDAQVVLLIKQHAKAAVSEFVTKGPDRMHGATPLPSGYKATK